MKINFDIISRATLRSKALSLRSTSQAREMGLALVLGLMAVVITVLAVDTDHDSNVVSCAYIRWGDPIFTIGDQYESAHPEWLLGAYKSGGEWIYDPATTQSAWHVSVYERDGLGSLNIDLDRSILLTNNLMYAIHYSAGNNASLYLDLLDTNGNVACHANGVVAENLYGNLLAISNSFSEGTRSVASVSNGGTTSTSSCDEQSRTAADFANSSILILPVPLTSFPDAAVIQLRCETGELIVYESLLYIDEAGYGLEADQERQLGTSDYSVDSNGNGISDYEKCFDKKNDDGATTLDEEKDNGRDKDKNKEEDNQRGVIYIDQAIGNDQFTGCSPVVNGQDGPKKTIRSGLAAVDEADTLIIKSGCYEEDLDLKDMNVNVIFEGNVRL